MSKEPIRKGKIRHESVQLRGPLWVDPRLKEKYKEYHLAWSGVSDRDSYSLGQYQDMGFSFIPKTDIEELQTGESNVSRVYTEGNWICTGTGTDTKSYLMKCPLDMYNDFQESEEERVKARRRALGEVTQQKGVYGSIKYGDESS